jgi:hypothetical protein
MKRRTILTLSIAAITLLPTGSGVFSQSEWRTMPDSSLGCKSVETMLKVFDLNSSGDQVAAQKLARREAEGGNCMNVKAGSVHIDEVFPKDVPPPLFSCVRKRGEPDCWWVLTMTIE